MRKAITNIALIIAVAFVMTGCASMGVNGAAGGAAVGAGIGQAIGHNTESTLIGAAVGTLFGYIGGNEWDKYQYRQHQHMPVQPMYPPPPQYQQPPPPQYYNPRRGY